MRGGPRLWIRGVGRGETPPRLSCEMDEEKVTAGGWHGHLGCVVIFIIIIMDVVKEFGGLLYRL